MCYEKYLFYRVHDYRQKLLGIICDLNEWSVVTNDCYICDA